MIAIKREIKSETMATANYGSCQASFNSDGNLTLRNYSHYDKNKDEIIIFSHEETQAILKLLRQAKENDLPF